MSEDRGREKRGEERRRCKRALVARHVQIQRREMGYGDLQILGDGYNIYVRIDGLSSGSVILRMRCNILRSLSTVRVATYVENFTWRCLLSFVLFSVVTKVEFVRGAMLLPEFDFVCCSLMKF